MRLFLFARNDKRSLTLLTLLTLLTSQLKAQVAQLPQAAENAISMIDLSVTAQPAYYALSEISTSPRRADYSFFAQRASVNIKIKEDPWIFNFRMEHISLAGVKELPPPLANTSTRYPKPGPGVFVSQAYLAHEGTLGSHPLFFKAGTIPIGRNDSLLLDDNGIGVFGFQIKISGLGPLSLEYMNGNTETSGFGSDRIIFNWLAVGFERTGRWTLAMLTEADKTPRVLEGGPVSGKATRNSFNLHYDQEKANFAFHSEFVLSQGRYFSGLTDPVQKVKSRTVAYVFEGLWRGRLPKMDFLGPLEWNLLYALGSGDKKNTEVDEAYFAPLATRFDGARRTGWGKALGATTFDALASTGTWNGLPAGLSGVTTFGFGVKSKPYYLLNVPLRLGVSRHELRATEGSGGISKELGGEWSFDISTNFAERFKATVGLYRFTPGKAYEITGETPRPINGVQAIVTLAFE